MDAPRGGEGIAAEREKIVVDPDALGIQDPRTDLEQAPSGVGRHHRTRHQFANFSISAAITRPV
jgi:hypothetical protein